jgi:cation diffusion facilitator CzcD-associated flavoprotein CzcO
VTEETFDVAIIGAGQGGIYDAYRLDLEGLSVVGLDGGSDFGGVWYHNRYPGARVDSDSIDYCFQFSRELYSKWRWPERYADAPTLFDYHSFVAEELDVRRHFRFGTWVCDSFWDDGDQRWHLTTSGGDRILCRFLVMCTGVLSSPKPLEFPGLDRFRGEWLRTSKWPVEPVDVRGLRVGVIGTGSSGVQVIPKLAAEAEHVCVFQRHPHWAVPARNGPLDPRRQDELAATLDPDRDGLFLRGGGPQDIGRMLATGQQPRSAGSYSTLEQEQMLGQQWEFGGHGISFMFADVRTDAASNGVVADFVRQRIRERVADRATAEKLSPHYPIGTRRLILEIDYYETFNQDNVTLVDVNEDPIVEVTETGVRTMAAHYDLDLLVFAIGFQSFIGPLEGAGVRNGAGYTPNLVWARGPKTLFGMMTPGFPNLFHPTNAGSPSVLGNAMVQHEFFGNWIAKCIGHMDRNGYASVEASDVAAEDWMRLVDGYAQAVVPLRRQQNQYMVHVNDDGSRFFIPFCAGMGQYLPKINEATSSNYAGFVFH